MACHVDFAHIFYQNWIMALTEVLPRSITLILILIRSLEGKSDVEASLLTIPYCILLA
jgi:hypothetical protein